MYNMPACRNKSVNYYLRSAIIILSFVFSKAIAQDKDTIYRLESLPLYDQDGNMSTYSQQFDHIPTSEDTAAFIKRGRGVVTKKMQEESQKEFDDFMKQYNQKFPAKSGNAPKRNDGKNKRKP